MIIQKTEGSYISRFRSISLLIRCTTESAGGTFDIYRNDELFTSLALPDTRYLSEEALVDAVLNAIDNMEIPEGWTLSEPIVESSSTGTSYNYSMVYVEMVTEDQQATSTEIFTRIGNFVGKYIWLNHRFETELDFSINVEEGKSIYIGDVIGDSSRVHALVSGDYFDLNKGLFVPGPCDVSFINGDYNYNSSGDNIIRGREGSFAFIYSILDNE